MSRCPRPSFTNEKLARFEDQGEQHPGKENSRYRRIERICDVLGKSEYFDGKIKLERWEGAHRIFLIVSKYTSDLP